MKVDNYNTKKIELSPEEIENVRERLRLKIDKRGPDDCWLFSGGLNGRGRPLLTLRNPKRYFFAYRLAWFLHTGVDPWPGVILHRCDCPTCCNPAHLSVGTQNDNVQDMLSKHGHYARNDPKRSSLARHPELIARGEANRSVLTEARVLEIRALNVKLGQLGVVSKQFGIARETLRSVVNGVSWRHLLPPDHPNALPPELLAAINARKC